MIGYKCVKCDIVKENDNFKEAEDQGVPAC